MRETDKDIESLIVRQLDGELREDEQLELDRRLIREAVASVCAQIMEAEASAKIGAEHSERAPEARTTHRNGYRGRRRGTRAGPLELLIPRTRQEAPSELPGAAHPIRAGACRRLG